MGCLNQLFSDFKEGKCCLSKCKCTSFNFNVGMLHIGKKKMPHLQKKMYESPIACPRRNRRTGCGTNKPGANKIKLK